jgi:hypothetical protein
MRSTGTKPPSIEPPRALDSACATFDSSDATFDSSDAMFASSELTLDSSLLKLDCSGGAFAFPGLALESLRVTLALAECASDSGRSALDSSSRALDQPLDM